MTRLPIRVKLTLAFALVMALVLGAVGVFLYLRFEHALDDTVDEGLRNRTADVVALVRESDSALAQGGSPLTERGEHIVQILDSRGRVVDAAPGLRTAPALTPAQLRRALRRPLLVERARVPGVETDVRLLATPVRAQDQRLVAVVGSALDDRDDAIRELIAVLLLGAPIALVLASAAGYAVATAALRPVEGMRRRAADISAGDLEQRLPVGAAHDEVGRLGETLNAMLARLEDAFARERTFVADASHELRTPLAILKTEIELALRGGRSVAELEDALRSAADETDRLAQLAEDLLVIARSDQGKLPLRTGEVDARAVLEAVRDRFARRAAEEGTQIELVLDGPVVLQADLLRLEQALANLVDNALRHGRGPVELHAVRGDRAVELEVRDAGDGFPPEFIAVAFERFTRADPGRSRGGTGLGLAIVQTIAEAHGGRARAENVAAGGARVVLELPGA